MSKLLTHDEAMGGVIGRTLTFKEKTPNELLVEAIAGQLTPNAVALYRTAERLEGVPYGSPPSHGRAEPRGAMGAKSPFISVVACLGRWSLPLGRAAAYQHIVPS
jgi:hypothetical protein